MNGNYNCIYCGKPVTMIGFKNYNIIGSGKDRTLQVFHPDCFKKNKGRKIKK